MLNNPLIISALLAHFLGDFVFQTNKIAFLKSKNVQGVSIHIIVTGVIHLIILSLFGLQGLALTAILLITHFFIDLIKLKLKNIKIPTTYFFIDQAMHLSTTILLAANMNAKSELITPKVVQYFRLTILVIICTYVATIVIKQLYFSLGILSFKTHTFFSPKEREIDGVFCAVFFALIYFRPDLYILYFFAAALLYLWAHKKAVVFDPKWLYVKLLFYITWGAGCFLIYLWL